MVVDLPVGQERCKSPDGSPQGGHGLGLAGHCGERQWYPSPVHRRRGSRDLQVGAASHHREFQGSSQGDGSVEQESSYFSKVLKVM